jgi:very-short-patch-repair endonuclease
MLSQYINPWTVFNLYCILMYWKEELPFYPYKPHLTTFAKQNRNLNWITEPERLVRHCILKEKKMKGYKFTRQKPILSFILDFYCAKLLLGIEIDGWYHEEEAQVAYDKERTEKLRLRGIKIIRIKNGEVMSNLEGVYHHIVDEISIREQELGLDVSWCAETPASGNSFSGVSIRC